MSLESNTLLNNRYRILKELASGGMGAVYRAHDENLDVEVAVKENFFVSAESARQFHREAQLLFELRHPSLPRVIDHFVVEDQGQYLVMDFIEGEDAGQILERTGEPLEEGIVMEWGGQVLEALAYLHSRRPPVIHRDIKPANFRITTTGRAMLVDFGLAKEYDPMVSTTVGAKAYTPGFAPPEQYGQGRTDPRTDIYSLGASLYNLLTNKIPADGLQRAMGRERLTPVRELNPRVSPLVAAAVERAVEVKPEARFESAEEFQAALTFEATSVGEFIPPASRSPSAPTIAVLAAEPEAARRRSRAPLIIGAFVVLAIGIGAALFVTGRLSASQSEESAVSATTRSEILPSETPLPAIAPPTVEPTEFPTQAPTAEPSEPPPPTELPPPAATPLGGGFGQIAFASERVGLPQIFVADVDGQNLLQLTDLVDGACQPTWSPDGEKLLFTSPCRQKIEDYPNGAIYVINADGSGIAPLISLVGGVYDAAWSEEGIAFTYLEGGQPTMWMAGPDGSAPRKLSIGNSRDRQPAWSPGRDRLVLMNTSRAGSPTLFWVFSDGSFNGSNPDQVTREQNASEPDWSPLGDVIAYTDNLHIWIVAWDAVGFGAVRLTDIGPNDGPSWSPDGRWMAFETWRDAANHDIYIMTGNGAQATRITSHPASEYHPAWRP